MSGLLPPFFGWSQIVTKSKPVGHRLTAPAFWEFLLDFEELTHDPETGEPYPEPTAERPCRDELLDMAMSGVCPATDGCEVEPDGTCPHGHPAWTRRIGVL